MRTLKFTLAYDGTDYVGWQRQAEGRSVQGELEHALAEVEGRAVTVHGAGRTDAGVHALGQAASVRLAHDIDVGSLVRALNAKLPTDIRVVAAEQVDDRFHARFAARQKSYRYYLVAGAVSSPFTRAHAWHVPGSLDVAAMRDAGEGLVGRHDFAAFQAVGTDVESTVRTIFRVSIGAQPLPGVSSFGETRLTAIDVVGDGFLRHMVRIMVGTLVSVGHGQRSVHAIGDVIASRQRERAGVTAPAHGLFLVAVDY